MINGETIKSLYDDKPTLMRWLKKVEAAVKATALDSITYRNVDGNTRIVAAFADGTEIASDPIKNLQVDELHVSNTAVIDTLEGVQQLGVEEEADIHNLNVDHIDVAHDAVIYGNAGVSGNMGIDKHLNVKGLIMTPTGLSTPLLTTSGDYINAEKPIIENMAGYSFHQLAQQYGNLSVSYAGAVKNGNKLTLAVAGTYEKTSDGYNEEIGYFSIPTAVNAKILPFFISGIGNVLELKALNFVDTSNGALLSPTFRLVKNEYGSLFIFIQSVTGLTTGHTYYFRYEVTFLLSDNLAA